MTYKKNASHMMSTNIHLFCKPNSCIWERSLIPLIPTKPTVESVLLCILFSTPLISFCLYIPGELFSPTDLYTSLSSFCMQTD